MPLGELQENMYLRESVPLICLISRAIKDGRQNIERVPDSYHFREAVVRQLTMRRIAIFVTVLPLFLLCAVAADAHAHLDHATPAVNSTVTPAPKEVVLWFTEKLEPAFSTIEVHDAKGAAVQIGKAQLDRSDRTQLRVALRALPPGTYKVIWHVLSVDTHRTQGNFSFRVAQ